MITIVLADDHRIVIKGFEMILGLQPDMEVVGEASSPEEALDMVAKLRPDVLVTDISMGSEKSGLLLCERVVESGLPTAVVMLSMHDEQEYLRQAMSRGARGYVLKSSEDDALFTAIRTAARGDTYICHELLGAFVQDAINGAKPGAVELTPRESEVVSLAVRGYSNNDIAAHLHISVKTVESQKSKIMGKLGLHTKPELFDYAASHGLIRV